MQEIVSMLEKDIEIYGSQLGPETEENKGEPAEEENEDDVVECEEEEYFFPTPDEVEIAKAPEEGMTFNSIDEAQHFVNAYGQLSGFADVKGRNYKNKKITLVCNRFRKPSDTTNPTRKRKRYGIPRSGCKMRVTTCIINGKWQMTAVDNRHNHRLVCSEELTKFFLKHRHMSEHEKNFSKILQQHRIKP